VSALRITLLVAVFGSLFLFVPPASAADEGDDLVQMVLGLLGEKDKDLRAVGLEQIRTSAKGAAATEKFAAQLPKLTPDAQVALLGALADRGDVAARSAVLNLLTGKADPAVRAAAITALGSLGNATDVPQLVKLLAAESEAEVTAAKNALGRMKGGDLSKNLAGQIKTAPTPVAAALIDVLAIRHANETVAEVTAQCVHEHEPVRKAAMTALAQMAGPEQIPGMLAGVLKATSSDERNAAEQAIVAVCAKNENADERVAPVLAALGKLPEHDQLGLLSVVGKVGGAKALAFVEGALQSKDTNRAEQGFLALCRWPDAAVADRLLALAKEAQTPEHRQLAFSAFVRVGSLRDGQHSDQERLARMKQAMEMAKSDAEKLLVIDRVRAAYIIEALRYVMPYLDQPTFQEQACGTIVELAHARELRDPNKAEFDKALDRVQALSKDPIKLERARRYKLGMTWDRTKGLEQK